MEKVLHLLIYTPYGKYLEKDADYISITSSVAVLGIMPNHAPLITTVKVCKLTVKINGKTEEFAIGGGVMHIEKGSKVTLLLDSIESKDEIDIDRANKAKERAEELLLNKSGVDVKRAKAALERALNRISVVKNK